MANKVIKKIIWTGISVFILTGCVNQESSGTRFNKVSSVEQVINEQTRAQESEVVGNIITDINGEEQENHKKQDSTEKVVDIDLAQMGKEMVFATLYQFTVDPESYVGKSVRIKGKYYPIYAERVGSYYHYCVIQDAAACCAQGLEFVWDKGQHLYPDEYPKEGQEMIVTGRFETYQMEGDPKVYSTLKDATLEIIE